MLLQITVNGPDATDIGYLLHKNPARCQAVELGFGRACIVYPEATPQRCTVALLLEVDPVGMVRSLGKRAGSVLSQYVNDRPYVASSLMSVAISQAFGSALAGSCKARPELVERVWSMEAAIEVLPCRGGPDRLHELFDPLGYELSAERHVLDERFPEWGDSAYYSVRLRHRLTLSEMLGHLYVLIPVLDRFKHYYVGQQEVEKLLRHGRRWLAEHPARESITRAYLYRAPGLARQALDRLVEADDRPADDESTEPAEERLEEHISLDRTRLGTVLSTLKSCGVASVIDLGCGEGKLLAELLKDKSYQRVLGVDVSSVSLERAERRLKLDRRPDAVASRVSLIQGSVTYRDSRFDGFDAATLVEVIEHLDPPRLQAMERVVFEFAAPPVVVLTTPNREYNVMWEGMQPGSLRHGDHRFEWTREQFRQWADDVAGRFGYGVRYLPVGPVSPEHGPPTQMAVFTRTQSNEDDR